MYFLTLLKKYIFKVYSLERPSARYEKKRCIRYVVLRTTAHLAPFVLMPEVIQVLY